MAGDFVGKAFLFWEPGGIDFDSMDSLPLGDVQLRFRKNSLEGVKIFRSDQEDVAGQGIAICCPPGLFTPGMREPGGHETDNGKEWLSQPEGSGARLEVKNLFPEKYGETYIAVTSLLIGTIGPN